MYSTYIICIIIGNREEATVSKCYTIQGVKKMSRNNQNFLQENCIKNRIGLCIKRNNQKVEQVWSNSSLH